MNQSIKNNLPDVSGELGIEKLQTKISCLYGLEKPEEINLLTALFVDYLADNLELIQKPAQIEGKILFPLACFPSLPIDFPDSAAMPLFLYGDSVCNESIENYGIVIGRFYAFGCKNKQWQWKYLILDEADSTTVSLLSTCTYWETELKPLD